MARKRQFNNSTEVRRELSKLYDLVNKDMLEIRKAEALKGLLNSIQISISAELKEAEIEAMEQLTEQLNKAGGK